MLVRAHRFGHGGEAADVGEEHDHPPLRAAELDRPLLAADLPRQVGCEVALEVRQHHRLAARILHQMTVRDGDRDHAGESGEEVEILLAERVGGAQVVEIDEAEHRPLAAEERGAQRALHPLAEDRPLAELKVRRHIFDQHGDPLVHRLPGDGTRHVPFPAGPAARLREMRGMSAPLGSFSPLSRIATRSTLITWKVTSTTFSSRRSISACCDSSLAMSSSRSSFRALTIGGRLAGDLEERGALRDDRPAGRRCRRLRASAPGERWWHPGAVIAGSSGVAVSCASRTVELHLAERDRGSPAAPGPPAPPSGR